VKRGVGRVDCDGVGCDAVHECMDAEVEVLLWAGDGGADFDGAVCVPIYGYYEPPLAR